MYVVVYCFTEGVHFGGRAARIVRRVRCRRFLVQSSTFGSLTENNNLTNQLLEVTINPDYYSFSSLVYSHNFGSW